MAYLTHTDYINITGTPLSVTEQGLVEMYFEAFTSQIDDYTRTTFAIQSNIIKTYNIPNCRATYVNIGSWQKNNLIVKIKANTGFKRLIEYTDYITVPSSDNKCIIGLDFDCLSCGYCECELIEITGDFGWQLTVPPEIKVAMIETIKMLQPSSSSLGSAGGIVAGTGLYLQSERSLTMSRTYGLDAGYATQANIIRAGGSIADIVAIQKLLDKYRGQTAIMINGLDLYPDNNCCLC